MADQPVIIEVALNGPTRRSRNPNVPITPHEIADDALACMDAGAAIVHQHDADGATSATRTAEQSLETYRMVLAERPDAILYPTATFLDPVSERWGAHAPLVAAGVLRTAYADPGSVNLGAIGAGDSKEPSSFVYVNSYADFAHQLSECRRLELGPNIAIFEPGFLRTALAHLAAGTMPAGAFIKLYFGGGGNWSFGLPPTESALDLYREMLGERSVTWAVAVLGGDVVECGMAGWALERGGHLRVGLEDHRGPNKPTNVELVQQAVALIEKSGQRVASPAEAASIIGLPKRD
ncbi:MAG: 3-keto-5-aminohexanoate cleavage protein [Actinomycetota bacterium]|nr:3-keto-5-aminohexanoate cleavage protein [Actinomycetota bacterium]